MKIEKKSRIFVTVNSVLVIVALGLLPFACDKDDDDDAAVVSELVGTWLTPCAQSDEDDDEYERNQVVFTATEFTYSILTYSDDACATLANEVQLKGPYTLGAAVTGLEDTNDIDMTNTTITIAVKSADLVTMFNSESIGGKSDWVLDTVVDATTLEGEHFSWAADAINQTREDIIKADATTMSFGVEKEDETRPTEIDTTTNNVFTKQ